MRYRREVGHYLEAVRWAAMFLLRGLHRPLGLTVTLGTQNLYLFARKQRLLWELSIFCIIIENQNCRLSLMPVFTTILVNYGLYLRTNQEKFQCDGIFLSLSIKRNSCLCLKRSPKLTEKLPKKCKSIFTDPWHQKLHLKINIVSLFNHCCKQLGP